MNLSVLNLPEQFVYINLASLKSPLNPSRYGTRFRVSSFWRISPHEVEKSVMVKWYHSV